MDKLLDGYTTYFKQCFYYIAKKLDLLKNDFQSEMTREKMIAFYMQAFQIDLFSWDRIKRVEGL